MINIKYKVLNKGYEFISENELLDTLLKNRGVENPKKLLHLKETDIHDGMLLNNMERGLNMLHWHLNNGSKVHILDDVDNDGITSATEIDNYIKDVSPNTIITHSMNDGKTHGIVLKNLKEYDFDLLIVPDAGSENIKECKILKEEWDVDILILDHHTYKKDSPYAILINCQDGKYPNNTLSGAGIVYKFIKEYDKKYGFNFADKYLDLTAIGIIGDSMDLRNYETRYLVLQGLKQINNSFIKEILTKLKVEEDETINIEFVGWKIAPYLNAVVRSGTDEEKRELIDAILGKEGTKEYQPRRKNKDDPKPEIEIQTLQQAMAREVVNIKARQDRLVKKGMELLIEKINLLKLDVNKVIMVDGTEEIEKTFTGLVANKLSEIYKRPVVVLKKIKNNDEEITYGGSFRNYSLSPIVSLMELFESVGTFDMLGGHPNAGGFKIKANKLEEATNKLNELLKDMSIEDVYLVDYEIPVGRLKEKHVLQIGKWKDIWGNTLGKPLFAITDITLNVEDIQLLGEKRNFIKFDKVIGKNKITFVKKFAGEEIYNKMIMKSHKGLSKTKSNKIKMDIVGEFVINTWNENEYPQVEIRDFNVTEVKDFRF
ncbi:MAG: DHH family phosphoesterase [Tissierellia bacterium]|nr:DHH family phosphoesterase [Tissierellia bacterium]